VTAFLRFLGVLNTALWLGAAVFLTIGLPGLFSDDLRTELRGSIGPAMAPIVVGWAAQAIFARFFILQYCCGAVGLAHLALEWLYGGKPLLQRGLGLMVVLTGLALAGGLWMQPRLNELQHLKYYASTQPARDQADRAFKGWHTAAECGNLAVIAGLLVHLWRTSRPGNQVRYGKMNLDKIGG
jgi:hypothetical protein